MIVALVTGSRKLKDTGRVAAWLDSVKPDVLIVGDADGADAQAVAWGKKNGLDPWVFKAEWTHWSKVGKRGWAGPVRNFDMARTLSHQRDFNKCECRCAAFPEGGPGTKDCIAHLRAFGFEPEIFEGG